MLETTEYIPIKNNGRDYTDCMEFSLLRFLHMIFYSKEQINQNNYSGWVINPENELIKINPDLGEWIGRFPKIYPKASYYLNPDGRKEREKWAKFVSDRAYFDYYRCDSAELFTNIRNIIILCKELLGMDLNIDDSDFDNLNKLSNILSEYTGKTIKMIIGFEEDALMKEKISNIKRLFSKPQPDIDNLDDIYYEIINKSTILFLTIDEKKYNWNLTEVYFKDNIVSNKFITGHSVIIAS